MTDPKKDESKKGEPKKELQMVVVRRLTLKVLVGGANRMRELATPKGCAIAEVWGIVTSSKEVKTQMPDGKLSTSLGLLGEFTGRNLTEDRLLYSPVLYLPEPVPGMVVAKLSGSGGDVVRVELAVRVSVIADEKSATGYTYETVSLKSFEPSPELAKLTASL